MIRIIGLSAALLLLAACVTDQAPGRYAGSTYQGGSCYERGESFCLTAPALIMKADPIQNDMLYLIRMETATFYVFEGRAANVPFRHRTDLKNFRSSAGKAEYNTFYDSSTYQAFIRRPENPYYPEIHIWIASPYGEQRDINYILSKLRLL